jgi:hypothetical protein
MKDLIINKRIVVFALMVVVLASPILLPIAEACPHTPTPKTIFFDDFNGKTLSIKNWQLIYVATGGSLKISSSLLHFVSPTVAASSSLTTHDYIRHWFTPTAQINKIDLTVRLKVNTFDRFAISVDHSKTNDYAFQNLMFNFNLRNSGVPATNNIATIGKSTEEIGGGPGVEGSMIDTLKTGVWYRCEISILRNPYQVTFSIYSDNGELLAQQTVAGSVLSSYGFDDIQAIGFNAWTSFASGPYGNVNIDWIRVTN